jgi:uncharacterized protein YdeI (YjbR/CyaY-like superfamily)
MKIALVDDYLRDGCGRCEHYRTPACKVHRFRPVLEALRELARASGLDEQVKWGSPCYTLGGKNVLMLGAFVEHCRLSFFKGAALASVSGADGEALVSPGPSSRFARYLSFGSVDEVNARRALVARLIEQAVALERAGVRVTPTGPREPMPLELEQRLAAEPALRRAFDALTPGRQRSHVLHVSGAKESETRARRAERCAPDILAGRGFRERAR